MILVLERFWPVIAAAAILGLLFAAVGGRGRALPSATRALRFGALAILASAILLAWMQVVPGRPGLWLETAALVFGAYGAGCGAGALLRRAVRRGTTAPAAVPLSAVPADPAPNSPA